MFLPLAERMVEKMVKEEKIEAEAEVSVAGRPNRWIVVGVGWTFGLSQHFLSDEHALNCSFLCVCRCSSTL